ncbi:MAG: DMT family transporter [Candidatus Neomarinimicrobiota bacterium]
MKLKVISLYILLCLVWGTTWFFIKISLEGTPPFLGAGLRFLSAGLILWGIVFWKKDYPTFDRTSIMIYLLFGGFNFGISYALSYWATQYIYSNLSAIIWAGFPLIVTLLAHFTLPDERLNPRKIISIIIGMSGVLLIISDSGNLGGDNVLAGILTVSLAVLLAAWPNVYLKRHQGAVKPIPMNAVSQTLAGIVILTLSVLFEGGRTMTMDFTNLFALAYLTIFGTVLAWVIYVWLFSRLSITLISYIAFFPPVVATIIGWLVLGEKLTSVTGLGALLVLTGILIMNRRRKPIQNGI